MKRFLLLAALAVAAILVSGPWLGARAEDAPASLPAGAMAEVDLSRGESASTFTAPTGSV